MSICSISAGLLKPSTMLTRGPFERAAAQDMEMHVKHALACVFAHIGDHSPSPIYFQTDIRRNSKQLAEESGIAILEFSHRGNVTLGYHQHMCRRNWIHVIERQYVLRVNSSRSRDFTGYDRTKETVTHEANQVTVSSVTSRPI